MTRRWASRRYRPRLSSRSKALSGERLCISVVAGMQVRQHRIRPAYWRQHKVGLEPYRLSAWRRREVDVALRALCSAASLITCDRRLFVVHGDPRGRTPRARSICGMTLRPTASGRACCLLGTPPRHIGDYSWQPTSQDARCGSATHSDRAAGTPHDHCRRFTRSARRIPTAIYAIAANTSCPETRKKQQWSTAPPKVE